MKKFAELEPKIKDEYAKFQKARGGAVRDLGSDASTAGGRVSAQSAANGKAVAPAPPADPNAEKFKSQILKVGSKGPAVEHLQSLLNGLGGSSKIDGAFSPATEKAVKDFQKTKGLTADGIVGPKTWTALGGQAGSAGAVTPPAGKHVDKHPPLVKPSTGTASQPLAPTGAAPQEVPQCFEFGGFPAFAYTFPTVPIATAYTATPVAYVEDELSLSGSVSVTFPNPPPGLTAEFSTLSWEVEAKQALGPLTTGLRLSGIDTKSPTLGVTFGSEYTTTECRFQPPNSMVYTGQVRIDYSVPSRGKGPVKVEGLAGFELKVTVYPRLTAPELVPVVVTEENWFVAHKEILIGVGVVLLVGTAVILVQPELALVAGKIAETAIKAAPVLAPALGSR